jgi:hypothetical protein
VTTSSARPRFDCRWWAGFCAPVDGCAASPCGRSRIPRIGHVDTLWICCGQRGRGLRSAPFFNCWRPLVFTSHLAEIILGPAHQGRILPGYKRGYASKHCRAGCPNCPPGIATRLDSRNICCGDFPLPWSRNRCSGREGPAAPSRAEPSLILLAQTKGPRQRQSV